MLATRGGAAGTCSRVKKIHPRVEHADLYVGFREPRVPHAVVPGDVFYTFRFAPCVAITDSACYARRGELLSGFYTFRFAPCVAITDSACYARRPTALLPHRPTVPLPHCPTDSFCPTAPLPPSSSDETHRTTRGLEFGRVDGVGFFLLQCDGSDEFLDVGFIHIFPAHHFAEVVFLDGEETGANLTVSRQPDPGARTAEHLRHRRDDSDASASAIGEAIIPRRLRTA